MSSKLVVAQDQFVADSLKMLLKTRDYNEYEIMQLLLDIAHFETSSKVSEEYSRKLIELANSKNNPKGLFDGYFQLGNSLRESGKWYESLDAFTKSLDFAKKLNKKNLEAITLLEVSQLYFLNNKYDTALFMSEEAIEKLRLVSDDSLSLSAAVLNTGYDYYTLGKYEKSYKHTLEASQLYQELNYSIGVSYALGNLGLVLSKLDSLTLAQGNLQEAINILKDLGDTYALTEFQTELASIHIVKGDFKTAEALLLESLAYAEEDRLQERIRDASLKLSQLYDSLDDHQKAYHHQCQYIAYRDSINNEANIRKIANLRAEYEIGQKQTELDLKHAEVELLTVQSRNHKLLLGGITIFVLLLLALIYAGLKVMKLKERLIRIARSRRKIVADQRDELQRLNETKDKFFSLISHDIRGPVNNFNGIAMLIQMHVEAQEWEEIEKVAKLQEKTAGELSSVLDNLLSWAMSQQGKIPFREEEIDLGQVANISLNMLSHNAIAKDIKMTERVEDLVKVRGDRNTISTIIRNLMSNALKFTDNGGQVDLRIDVEGEYGVIYISDTGIGISDEKIGELFGFTGERTRRGTSGEKGVGLGLNLVHEFVHLNKGKVEVDSEVGVGTTFKVYLPLA
ncbi:ATP-binding protein [Reichenbachiella versicolor]|uniref:ATP-binding protein n=1 Tax=Reichenbachiella versicolor TaxID=1821036 RepID=UPI0013A58738|nr:ATP-binding protein [Reichenbachiella versicolor]